MKLIGNVNIIDVIIISSSYLLARYGKIILTKYYK